MFLHVLVWVIEASCTCYRKLLSYVDVKKKNCFSSQVIIVAKGELLIILKKVKEAINTFKNGDNCLLMFLI